MSLVSFLIILWGLSGPARGSARRLRHVSIPAYLVWTALIYAGVGTWLTIKIGRPLVSLNFAQQRFEADFRFSLMRLRENAESIAFFRGEARRAASLPGRFAGVFDNFWPSWCGGRPQLVHLGYGQAAVIFPYLVAAPRYFSGAI